MFTKTKIALAAALIIGAASAAMANDSGENHQDQDRGSVIGVNHLTWSGNSASAGGAYGYAAAPIQQKDLSRKKSHNH
jgi:hypothetical protein